jgi:hypothetical protein
MKAARKKATDFILPIWQEIDPSGMNAKMLKEALDALSDEEFDNLINELEAGTAYLPIWMPNFQKSKISVENNFKVAKKYGIKFYQKVWEFDPSLGIDVLSNIEYFCGHFLERRQIQTLESKISLPEDQKHLDDMTDQPTGVSKGSSISGPEFGIMLGQDSIETLKEFMGPRGGDLSHMTAIERSIHETGKASLEATGMYAKGAKSIYTLSTLLAGMHFDNNFAKR